MRTRFLELMGVAVIVMALVNLTSFPVSDQAPTAAKTGATATAGSPGKTPWGEPNLQGIWSDDFQIPLERPAQYAGRESLTDAEVAEIDKVRAADLGRDERSKRGSEAAVNGVYNAVFVSVRKTGHRTSLIVDPPDGRIPPLTPAATEQCNIESAFRLALLQATSACKNKTRACAVTGRNRFVVHEPGEHHLGMPQRHERFVGVEVIRCDETTVVRLSDEIRQQFIPVTWVILSG